jgi:hypothetical protein
MIQLIIMHLLCTYYYYYYLHLLSFRFVGFSAQQRIVSKIDIRNGIDIAAL